jgi:hypothetical protein
MTFFRHGGPTIRIPSIANTPPPMPEELTVGFGLEASDAADDDTADAEGWTPKAGDPVTVHPVIDEDGRAVGYMVGPRSDVSAPEG